ncbi:MAG TPA: 30S ribosomal protein S20 [Anaerolineales bacterium]|nr:30S ribosomal protein S20 [Anaerolineales bacterium]HRQ92745.1 30S ribosomal protein S20 [Anaerolineales bacterium]
MANIKSAIKRNRQNEKRRVHNRLYRGSANTFVRKANAAIAAGEVEQAKEATKAAVSALDKAAKKNIIHANNAARRKGALMSKLNALQTGK